MSTTMKVNTVALEVLYAFSAAPMRSSSHLKRIRTSGSEASSLSHDSKSSASLWRPGPRSEKIIGPLLQWPRCISSWQLIALTRPLSSKSSLSTKKKSKPYLVVSPPDWGMVSSNGSGSTRGVVLGSIHRTQWNFLTRGRSLSIINHHCTQHYWRYVIFLSNHLVQQGHCNWKSVRIFWQAAMMRLSKPNSDFGS